MERKNSMPQLTMSYFLIQRTRDARQRHRTEAKED